MSLEDAFDDDDFVSSTRPDFWDPETPGDQLVGYVVDIREDPFGDENTLLDIETEDGTTYSTKTHAKLQDLIDDLEPEEGELVAIRFIGTVDTDNGDMYDYEMAVDRDE